MNLNLFIFTCALGQAWPEVFKNTKVKLEPLTDFVMLLMVEFKGIISAMCHVIYWYPNMQKLITNILEITKIKNHHSLSIETGISFNDGQCHESYIKVVLIELKEHVILGKIS